MNLLPSFLRPHPEDSSSLWRKLSHIMAVTIELYPLANQLLDNLLADLHFKQAAFILIEEHTINDVISKGFGIDFSASNGFSYDKIAPSLKYRHLVGCQEIEDLALKTLFEQLSIKFMRILRVEEQIVGILILGGQQDGFTLSLSQKQLLDDVCDELSIALSNSRSYGKIKQFNITLSQAVKQATEHLESVNKQLEVLDKSKDEFVSIASHELRTPMTAVRSYAWMALNKPDSPLSEKMNKYLSRILISTERSINMVNDLLSVSRLETGHLEFKLAPISLSEVAQEVLEEMEAKLSEKKLKVQIIPSALPQVMADQEKVAQVFLNILGNAVKYTDEGGSLEISFLSDGVMVETHIKDSGIGISADDLSRLFAKFGRLDNSLTAVASKNGTGLGLYISKGLISQMSGRMWASSEGVGKGSTFSFALPIATETLIEQASQYAIITTRKF